MFTIIPAIDLLDGQVVRLTQGDYNQVIQYDYSPAQLAQHYANKGATRIHIVDLNGAKDGKLVNESAIRAIRAAVDCELELGGGIRTLDTASQLFNLGINYLVLGSLLVKDFDTSSAIINAYPNKIIAGIDLKNGQVAVEGWEETVDDALQPLLDKLEALPISAIISTEISRDGMMQGPDLDGLTALCNRTSLPVIASGGVSTLDDIHALKTVMNQGMIGCIIGKAILSGAIDMDRLWS